ncbi:MAG: NAD(P)H-dependent oxidoreductase subunit E [Fibrobacterales bacterium]
MVETTCSCQETKKEKLEEILNTYSYDKRKLIPILQAVQREYRWLPKDVLKEIAIKINTSPANVFGVASFYGHFALKPKGETVVRVCNGTACNVKGSQDILDALYKKLELTSEENTTPDMKLTVEAVACIGACGLAPVLMINDDVHGQMNPEESVALVQSVLKNVGKENG